MRRQAFYLDSGEEGFEEIILERRGSRCRIFRKDGVEDVDAAPLADGRLSLIFESGRHACARAIPRGGDGVDVVSGGGPARRVPISRTRPGSSGRLPHLETDGGVDEVVAPMHGRLIEVRAAVGDRVDAGLLLFVLEAMKMQNEIRAVRPGTVESAKAAAGDTVEAGAVLMSIRSDKN